MVGEPNTEGEVSVACQGGRQRTICCVSDWLEGESRVRTRFDSACNCGQFGIRDKEQPTQCLNQKVVVSLTVVEVDWVQPCRVGTVRFGRHSF